MPLVKPQPFKIPLHHFNGHAQTIIPSFFRKVEVEPYQRERVFTPDGDFLDLDWVQKAGNSKVAIISHGLEGDSQRHYVRGTAKILHENGWDICAWNCRSCSGEMNKLKRFYHHGDSPDLAFVIDHVRSQNLYQEIFLIGYSMGGNITLRYMGERGDEVYPEIKRAMAVSVPCQLGDCVIELEKQSKMFYNKRFYGKLRKKLEVKAQMMPDQIDLSHLKREKISSCRKLDRFYFAPIHGYPDEETFYKDISSFRFLPNIKRPTLLLTAQNDPFLGGECYPTDFAKNSDAFYLEMPEKGGHVGFCMVNHPHTYSEMRALEFAETGR